MVKTKLAVAALAFVLTSTIMRPGDPIAAEFSAEATALPFPPDARDLEFVAWTRNVKFNSHSPLNSLAAFYLKEMAARGWQHDEPAAKIDKDSIKLKFKHDQSEVELSLSQWSKEVRVSLDCEGLKFNGTDDPAKLVSAGIPVPRAVLFVQKELPLPAGAVDLQYTGEGCMFKSPLKLQEAFDHFLRLIPGKGFRESRRPIITDTRRYTEFKKGTVQLSVNVFTHEVGSRIILEYKDETPEKSAPPLAAVASLPIKNSAGAAKGATSEAAPPAADATPIVVTTNKGSASINYAGKQYTFSNVASFQTKSRSNSATMVVFSAQPIPVNKMQSLIATKDDFSFEDLYERSAPNRLILQLGDNLSFTFALSNVYVGNSIDNPVNEMKLDAGRVQGTLKMPPKEIFRGEQFSFTATADAAIITPSTRITGPGDPVVRSDNPLLADAPVPFPDGVENAGSEGSKFRKTYSALVRKPLAEVSAFYHKELSAKGWTQSDMDSAGDAMRFKNDKLELALKLKQQGSKTAVEVVTRDIALAKQEGVFPEPGKGRLVLGNASNVAVVFTIGSTNYPLKPGQGAKDYKQALNYSLAPGSYTVVVRIPGQPQQSEKIELAEGSTWGIIALPMGGAFPVQLY
jgi:hypothetical protein